MAELPVEAGVDVKLLAYGGAHPFIHFVDVAAGKDLPVPSPADVGSDALDRLLRREGYFAFTQSHALVTLPSDLDGAWRAVDGRWAPVPARDPRLMWVTPSSRDAALLIDRWGQVRREVAWTGTAMLRAEVEAGVVIEDDHGTMTLLGFAGTTTPWHDVMVAGVADGAVVGAERHGPALVRFDASGNETGRASVEDGWRWSFLGSLSPNGRYYLDEVMEDIPFHEVLEGARSERRLLVGDLETGALIPVDTVGHSTGYRIWDRGGERVFLTTFTDLGTFTVNDPTLRRATSARIKAAPLMDVTGDLESFPRTLPRRLGDRRGAAFSRAPGTAPVRSPASLFEGTTVEADAASLATSALRAMRMVATYDTRPRQGSRSRLGGRPTVSRGFAWPRAEDRPLLFVGQVDFRDTRGLPGAEELPGAGVLGFWFDSRETPVWGFDPADRAYWRIAYFPEHRLTDADAPDDLPDEAHIVAQPLSFESEITFPPYDLVAGPFGWTPAQEDAYDDLIAPGAGPVHRLLGHPNPVQSGEMASECRLAANGIPADTAGGDLSPSQQQRRRELLEAGEPWRQLLQIDSDSGAGLDWCGGGRLYVWIREVDLHAHHFDDCWVILQTD
jgi:uncharacterized protein YwqG